MIRHCKILSIHLTGCRRKNNTAANQNCLGVMNAGAQFSVNNNEFLNFIIAVFGFLIAEQIIYPSKVTQAKATVYLFPYTLLGNRMTWNHI